MHDAGHVQSSSDASFVQILSEAPDRINWRVYDHCAGVTRLYALYEGFVEALSYADFVEILCAVLAEMAERQFLTRSLEVRQSLSVGQVVHVFSNNIVGLRCCKGHIRVGERLVAKGVTPAVGTTVISMEIDRQKCEEANLSEGQEIGLQLDKKTKVGTELLRLNPAPQFLLNQTPIITTDNCQI